ncbi:intercellular adhesion molecule 5 [Spea bombifrons]|uniref:intercellular adhesion molecule 5 n=1 Tax=Spea bombifrons TaxID=233779 RepID=UPI002349D1EB|nr:intercellular adhesion molecule 5 [Spea bombifrons]
MEKSFFWIAAAVALVSICRVHASLPVPVLTLEDNIMEGEEAEFSCTLLYNESSEVDLEILTSSGEPFKDCQQQSKPFPKVTCNPEVTKEFHNTEVTCEARLSIRSKPKTIFVRSEPAFTDCPQEVTWVEGEKKSFHCKAGGYPPPTVTCSMDKVTYKEGDTFTVSRNMSGRYTCRASSFDVITTKVTVSVEFKPKVLGIKGLSDLAVAEGENVTLVCEADGLPSPTYSWDTPTPAVEISADHRTVAIGNMEAKHKGEYICKVQNIHGNDATSLTLTVPGSSKGEKPTAFYGFAISALIVLYLIPLLL